MNTIACIKCEEPFKPKMPHWRICPSCITLPRLGCAKCGKEAKVERTGVNSCKVTCCGITEHWGNGRQKPMSKEVKDFLGPDIGDILDATVGNNNGLFDDDNGDWINDPDMGAR